MNDDLWLNRVTRAGSEGSLPVYSTATVRGGSGRPSGARTISSFQPTLIEMEDLGSDNSVQPPPPGEEIVTLPPPPPRI
jgi:hypothetical protein